MSKEKTGGLCPVSKTLLPNGMQVLIAPNHHIPQVAIQMWYNVGAKHEVSGERGMAHLIEHMCFKGTEKLSESDMNVIVQKLAGYNNAFTSHDYTSYIFQVPSNAWEEPLEILAPVVV